jgi:protein involved in polysaccharide export with SLBB domain
VRTIDGCLRYAPRSGPGPTLRSLLLSLWLALGCHASGSSKLPTAIPEEDTTLGPGDVFDINVFGEKELTGKYKVGPDGTIRFPFLGTLSVGGKEADAVAHEITRGLKEGNYILDPHVSVFVEQSNSKRISVIGAVAKPGTFPIVPGMTVVQAVSNAGGFTPLASKDDTVVTRRINGKLERYRIPVSEVSRGNADDFPLRSGDLVFVPERVF